MLLNESMQLNESMLLNKSMQLNESMLLNKSMQLNESMLLNEANPIDLQFDCCNLINTILLLLTL